MPQLLYPQERAPIPHWIGGWLESRAGLNIMEKKKILALPEIQPWPSSPYPIAVPTELSMLILFPVS
jgi:hypothetical protein